MAVVAERKPAPASVPVIVPPRRAACRPRRRGPPGASAPGGRPRADARPVLGYDDPRADSGTIHTRGTHHVRQGDALSPRVRPTFAGRDGRRRAAAVVRPRERGTP